MEQLGRYRLIEELGSGGFAIVYRAQASRPGGDLEPVALKLFHPNLAHEDPDFVQSLMEEARICSLIQHHHVVQFHELACEADLRGNPQYYMVMELVEGVTLEALPWMAAKRGERVPASVALELMAQVAEGLQHVHTLRDPSGRSVGMVHRDLKPSNVLVSRDGVAKILDFGIAKALDAMGPKTATGMTRGTAAYMSPEQAFGKAVAPAADQFSFGALLFFVTVGEPLICADTMASELLAVVNTPADHRLDELEQAVPGLGSVFLTLRQPDPGERLSSMAEVASLLRGVSASLSNRISARSYIASLLSDPAAQVSRREMRRRPTTGSQVSIDLTLNQLGPQVYDREGQLVTARDAALSWGVPEEELSEADLEFLPEPDERDTAVMPSAETPALSPADVPSAAAVSYSGPVPQATPSTVVPPASTPAAPVPGTATPGRAIPGHRPPAAQSRRSRDDDRRPWGLLLLLLLPMGAVIVGVAVLGLASLWVTPAERAGVDALANPGLDPSPVADPGEPGRADGLTDDPAEEPAEQTAEEPVEEPAEEPGEDPAEAPAEEPVPVAPITAPPEPVTPAPVQRVTQPEPAPPEPQTPAPETRPEEPLPASTETGTLRLNAYPAAKVYVDGEYVGTTLETAQGVRLSEGRHSVKLVRSTDGFEKTITVKILPHKVLSIPFDWTAE